jgi:hypothetical protein
MHRLNKNGRRPTTGSSLRNRSRPNRLRNRRNRILCSHSRDLRHSRDIHRRHHHDIRRSRRNRALPV